MSVSQGKLSEEVSEQPPSPSPASSSSPPPPPQKRSSEERKQRWEAGQIDYLGDDAFANIEQKLDSFLK